MVGQDRKIQSKTLFLKKRYGQDLKIGQLSRPFIVKIGRSGNQCPRARERPGQGIDKLRRTIADNYL